MIIIGRIISNKKQASNLIADLSKRFDGTMETSTSILEIEEKLVNAGLITWEEAELAELI